MGIKPYDKLFKEQAVKLSEQRGTISDFARELGISSSHLTKWRNDFQVYGDRVFRAEELSASQTSSARLMSYASN